MTTILQAHNVTKIFEGRRGSRVLAIENLSMEVEEGEFLCLLGTSGCGKSTIINMFAGFTSPSSGSVTLRGESIKGIEPRCGMVFQAYALFPWKTVIENVEFGLKMQGMGRKERNEQALHYLDLVKLTGFARHFPMELSGGMQQRVTIARCLAANPEVLLMDEPFAALDAMTRQVMQEELLRIQEVSKKTIVFITHNIDEALILADRIIVLSARPGRVKEIFKNDLMRPRHVTIQLEPEYAALKFKIWRAVEDEVSQHVS
jgi:NitT/TauT family transport system ATP-binding protein